MEFKGTKGKWKRVLLETTDFCQRRNEIHYGKDGECVAEYVHNDYDALLISKAPKMLEMLKELRNAILSEDYVRMLANSQLAKELIKEATEIKNK
jgi:hypothetical protein